MAVDAGHIYRVKYTGHSIGRAKIDGAFTSDQTGSTFQCKRDAKKIAETPAKESFSVFGAPRSPSPGRAA